ncbi:hypothetical protein AVEN_236497-1 [Araneus ventricosus]|uniref:CCHC-type domain-containing protein n=1 Tax=Araneus ventricosus TaxID=182803 RepID=A0A4Y2NT81_ARAVE|nr:hypothetical protein AVEN_236497-1 [Araneus ventricosus]
MVYLKYQNVSAVKRISIRKDGQYVPTKHLILTFNVPNLPKSVLIAYINCPVRPYAPDPLRCYKCQKFGHSVQSCRGNQACARCAEIGHASNTCEAAPLCANCKGDHPSYARSSPRWKDEKEIQAVKVKQNVSFREARKIVADRTPKVGVSYASQLKPPFICTCGQTKFSANSTEDRQQDLNLREIPVSNPKFKFSSNANRGGLSNMEKDKRENTSTKPNQPLSRSLIPKINPNLEAEGKVTHPQSKSEEKNDEPDKSLQRPSASTSGTKVKKKVVKLGKETKAAKKARISKDRQRDPKLKEAVKKRSYSKNDFLTLAGKTNTEDDVDMLKGYPTDDSDVLTDFSEDTLLPTPS